MLKIIPRHTVNLNKEIFKIIFNAILKRQFFLGPHIEKFGKEFANYTGTKYAIGISSAGIGLYLSLKALGLNENDEIILSAYNFHIIPKIIKYLKLKPVFVDIDPDIYNIDTSLIHNKITGNTKAIIVTHLFGQPCAMDRIMDIAKEYKLKIIEDCAHACGAMYKDKRVGSFGDIGIFSFGLGKNLPCCGGGMITTNNDSLAVNIKNILNKNSYSNDSNVIKRIIITTLAYFITRRIIYSFTIYPILRFFNFLNSDLLDKMLSQSETPFNDKYFKYLKLANIQAMIGLKQLKRLENINARLIKNVNMLTSELKSCNNINLFSIFPDTKNIFLYYRIKTKNCSMLRKYLLKRGIDTQYEWLSVCPNLDIFCSLEDTYPNAKLIHINSLQIPNHFFLSESDIRYICDTMKNWNRYESIVS